MRLYIYRDRAYVIKTCHFLFVYSFGCRPSLIFQYFMCSFIISDVSNQKYYLKSKIYIGNPKKKGNNNYSLFTSNPQILRIRIYRLRFIFPLFSLQVQGGHIFFFVYFSFISFNSFFVFYRFGIITFRFVS